MRRQRHTLILRRHDHKRDAIGAVFLGAVTDEAAIRGLVERYLGPVFQVREVAAEGTALRAVVECSRFQVESQNLSRIARSAADRGQHRAAGNSFNEALKLDPLNTEALKGHAKILLHTGELQEAEEKWIRAGEIRGYDGEILRGLASVALRADRRATAMQYLEEALVVNPEDTEAHALLDELYRQAELRFEASTEEKPPGKK